MNGTQKKFIEEVGRMAVSDHELHGILPSVTIAQAILESNWGSSELCKKANALFGIKADRGWTGRVYNILTKEVVNNKDVLVNAGFRAYDEWEDSVTDHGAFISGLSRYRKVVGNIDYIDACKQLKLAGYATDPSYAEKLIGIIEDYALCTYDMGNAYDVPEAVNTVYYLVSPGDTLNRIAQRHFTTVESLVKLNGIQNPNLIYIGQKLRLN